jgi:uncharacterized protein (AIM24 family)
VLAGESLFLTHFHNASSAKRTLAFAAPYPGKIIPLDLATLGGDFTCQKDSFLCAAKGTQLDITFTKNIGVGLFGGEVCSWQTSRVPARCTCRAFTGKAGSGRTRAPSSEASGTS